MDKFSRTWIIKNALDEIQDYEPGVLTIRALHYRLVGRGMTNSQQHYKRVVAAMIKARWEGLVPFNTFSDHEREVLGLTEYEPTSVELAQARAQRQIAAWMNSYNKNLWENQQYYLEIWIEKKALQGTFEPITRELNVALAPCKGYPSLTFLNDAAARFEDAGHTHRNKILYFGDYDPSGEDIPRSIEENLINMGIEVEVERVLLLEEQVVAWNLPPAPVKKTDTRTAAWDGLGQVELDAVEPKQLQRIVREKIQEHLDEDLHEQLQEEEQAQREVFRANLKKFVKTL